MVTKNRSAFYNESGSAFYNESGSESGSSPRFITYHQKYSLGNKYTTETKKKEVQKDWVYLEQDPDTMFVYMVGLSD